jgi:hypothetical protein
MLHRSRTPVLLTMLLVPVAALGCNSQADGPGNGTDAGAPVSGNGGAGPPARDGGADSGPPNATNARACGNLQRGPFAPVMAQATFNLQAPPIQDDRQAYRIMLPVRASGYVTFDAPAAGQYIIFTSTVLPVVVFGPAGAEIPFLAGSVASSVPECPEVKGKSNFSLGKEKHLIRLGPEATGIVDVVITAATP